MQKLSVLVLCVAALVATLCLAPAHPAAARTTQDRSMDDGASMASMESMEGEDAARGRRPSPAAATAPGPPASSCRAEATARPASGTV